MRLPIRVVIGLVHFGWCFLEMANRNWNFQFVKSSSGTDQNGWNSIDFGFDRLSVFCALSLGRLDLWFFSPKIFCLGFFFFFFFFFFYIFKMQYSSQVFFGPFWAFMLFVIKPFLETYFMPFLGTSFGPNSSLFYFGHFWAIFRNLFWLFLGLFTHP